MDTTMEDNMLYLTLAICFFTSILMTPLVKKLAFKIGATDKPNHRKVHSRIMPRLGGLAIFISFIVGILIFNPSNEPFGEFHVSIVIGGIIIILTGMLDDVKE